MEGGRSINRYILAIDPSCKESAFVLIDEETLKVVEMGFLDEKIMLSYVSDLQERFYNEISYRYGAERGESKSRLKYTSNEQIKRFNRKEGDEYDIMPEIKGIWI